MTHLAQRALQALGNHLVEPLPMFVFRFLDQAMVTQSEDAPAGGAAITDRMVFSHIMDGRSVTPYNRLACPPRRPFLFAPSRASEDR